MPRKPVTRRSVVKMAGAATATAAVSKLRGAPAIQKVHAANNVVNYGMIGTGSRGTYLIRHLNSIDGGRLAAVCDIKDEAAANASKTSKDKPQQYKDYRELLARKDIDAVIVTTPLYMHFPPTRDALLAGKHVFCEKSLVFKPEEVHALRKLSNERPKLVLQTGLQRRYSRFYQTVKQMIDKGMLGQVSHVYAQWNRNPGWTMRPGMWRLHRQYSGGLTAELASHQIDVADWMFGSHPEFVVGVGGLDYMKDGRDIYDNIQLIFKYPKGQKLIYTSICTNKHMPLFYSNRTEFGEMIMGTDGTIHITVGTDEEPALALWFYEPGPKRAGEAKKEKAAVAGATLATTGKGGRGVPVMFSEALPDEKDSFLAKELKFARMWLYRKGIMVPEEDRNPVDVELESFFECCRTGARPRADLEVGLADSTSVMLANLAMDEGRRV
ncbi:MAG: Gfo/Idh/MocA family protein, partial [Bryobacteraceae bacterium]